MQNEECRMQNGVTSGFALGWIIGKKHHVKSSGCYPVVHDTTGMEKFWQRCNGLTPETEAAFRKGWFVGAGYPLPEQDWSGYDG